MDEKYLKQIMDTIRGKNIVGMRSNGRNTFLIKFDDANVLQIAAIGEYCSDNYLEVELHKYAWIE
jgi:hypothetical protein